MLSEVRGTLLDVAICAPALSAAAFFLSNNLHLLTDLESVSSHVSQDLPVPTAKSTPLHFLSYLAPFSSNATKDFKQFFIFLGCPLIFLEARIQSLSVPFGACIIGPSWY